MAKPTSLTSIALFLVVAYGLAIVIGAIVLMNGGLTSQIALPALITVMFCPGFAAILVTKLVDHDSLKVNGIVKGRARYYFLAWSYPIAVILIGLILVSLLRTAPVNFDNLAKILPRTPGVSSSVLLPVTIAGILLRPFINFVPALGEEYGWRGFLQPALIERLGLLPGLTMTGIFWGLWHAPIILQGYNYAQHPNLVGVFLFTLWTVLVAYFLGWVRLKSNSCLPTALGHGSINAYMGLGFVLAPTRNELLGLPLGLPAFLALAIIATIVLYDLHRHTG
jgi:membrane protease YdiL (CAAX protease family)